MRLFLLLVAVPVIEIALFIEIGGWLGTWPTIAIVILTALIGSVLLRRQGLKAMNEVQSRLMQGEHPGRLLADGAMILVAGALLLTPGFFTDAVGFLLLIPGFRTVLFHWLARNIKVRTVNMGGPGGGPAHDMGMNRGPRRGRAGPAGAPEDGDTRWQTGRPQTIDGEYAELSPNETGTGQPGTGADQPPSGDTNDPSTPRG